MQPTAKPRPANPGDDLVSSEPASPYRLLGAPEIAGMLGVPEKTVLNLYRAGRLPGVKIGRRVRFIPQEIIAAVETAAAEGRSI